MKNNKQVLYIVFGFIVVALLGAFFYVNTTSDIQTGHSKPNDVVNIEPEHNITIEEKVIPVDKAQFSVKSKLSQNIRPDAVDLATEDTSYLKETIQVPLATIIGENKTANELLAKRGKNDPKPSKYLSITTLEELISVTNRWHYSRAYDDVVGRFSKTKDLLQSARRLAGVKDDNWDLANYYLGILYIDTQKYDDAAQVFNNIINETEAVDNYLMQEAMLKLAMIEYTRPISLWGGRIKESIIQPEEQAWDVAEDMFMRIDRSNLHCSDMGASISDIADTFLEALRQKKRDYRKNIDDVTATKTSLLIAREIYNMNPERGKYLGVATQLSESKAFKEYMATAPIKDRNIWGTYVGWALFERHKYEEAVNLLCPMINSNEWGKEASYIYAQYYLAVSYEKLGQIEEARNIAKKINPGGFALDNINPVVKEYATKIKNE